MKISIEFPRIRYMDHAIIDYYFSVSRAHNCAVFFITWGCPKKKLMDLLKLGLIGSRAFQVRHITEKVQDLQSSFVLCNGPFLYISLIALSPPSWFNVVIEVLYLLVYNSRGNRGWDCAPPRAFVVAKPSIPHYSLSWNLVLALDLFPSRRQGYIYWRNGTHIRKKCNRSKCRKSFPLSLAIFNVLQSGCLRSGILRVDQKGRRRNLNKITNTGVWGELCGSCNICWRSTNGWHFLGKVYFNIFQLAKINRPDISPSSADHAGQIYWSNKG